MAITEADVAHVALLARLAISDDERRRYAEQLSAVLDHMALLAQVDTSAIPATAQVLDAKNVFGADEPRPSLPREVVLAAAPQTENGYIRVRAVLED